MPQDHACTSLQIHFIMNKSPPSGIINIPNLITACQIPGLFIIKNGRLATSTLILS